VAKAALLLDFSDFSIFPSATRREFFNNFAPAAARLMTYVATRNILLGTGGQLADLVNEET